MPAVRNASGPISVPGCEAPISIGTPSRAMRGFFGLASDVRWLQERGCLSYALKYAIWVRGREQASVGRPQFAVLVAVTLVKDLGVGDGEHAA